MRARGVPQEQLERARAEQDRVQRRGRSAPGAGRGWLSFNIVQISQFFAVAGGLGVFALWHMTRRRKQLGRRPIFDLRGVALVM